MTSNFGSRGLDGLARFESDQARQVLAMLLDGGSDSAQNGFALAGRHPPRFRKRAHGGCDGSFDVSGAGSIGDADDMAAGGRSDFDWLAGVKPPSIHQEFHRFGLVHRVRQGTPPNLSSQPPS